MGERGAREMEEADEDEGVEEEKEQALDKLHGEGKRHRVAARGGMMR